MTCEIVWFRNDLRLFDHEPLVLACDAAQASGGTLIPTFVLDPRLNGTTSFGLKRVGKFRSQFLFEALIDLDEQLRRRGSRLRVLQGAPEDVLTNFARVVAADRVWLYEEIATEESNIQDRLRASLSDAGIQCRRSMPSLLHAFDELPFETHDTPEVFSKFRRIVEKKAEIPPPLATPRELPPMPTLESLPTNLVDDLPSLLPDERATDSRAVMDFRGGETAGLARLNEYLWERDCLRRYKETRNGMLGADYSSKLSPWLAHGCVSARLIYREVQRYESERVANDSTYWLIFELLWRDYFALMVAKHGAEVFKVGGLRRQKLPWKLDEPRFKAWTEGQTGYPLIDANMRELSATGFMSNRGRQNVASFLTKNLGIDWRLGAEWFESLLVDYDPCSNYGNWNYAAGVGNDARGFRWFNTIKQSNDYDPNGDYVRHWLPELSNVPTKHIHTPWKMHRSEQKRSDCIIGVDYPNPVVDLFQSANANEHAYSLATMF